MKNAISTAAVMILAIGLLYRPFVALDRCSYAVGIMISILTLSTESVDQQIALVGFYEILESKDDLQDSRWAIPLTKTILLIALVWSQNRRAVENAPDVPEA